MTGNLAPLHAAIVALGLLLGGAAAAEEQKCPKGDAAIFAEDLQAIPTCAEAHKVHEACAWGSSGDVPLSSVVIEKCEALFLKKLNPAQKRNYDARVKRCEAQFSRQQGTLALAEMALCQEGIAASFAQNAAAAGSIKAAPLTPVKASFDCRKAQTPLEELICSSEEIADSDVELSKTYQKAFRAADPDARKQLVASEKAWLGHVAATCLNTSVGTDLAKLCADGEFRDRIEKLPACMTKAGKERESCLVAYPAVK